MVVFHGNAPNFCRRSLPFFAAGVQEANTAKSNNSTIVDLVQKVMYINETRNETIFAEPVNYLYTSSDVLIMTRTYAVSSNQ